MTKFLLAIVLLVCAVRYTYAHSLIESGACDMVKMALPAEEESKAGEKELQEKNKTEFTDHIIFPGGAHAHFIMAAGLRKNCRQPLAYFSFAIRSLTPPPEKG